MKITWEILQKKSLEEAEDLYNNGLISDNLWIQYCYLWRNGATRLSGLLSDFEVERR